MPCPPGSGFIKPDQRDPWIKDELEKFPLYIYFNDGNDFIITYSSMHLILNP